MSRALLHVLERALRWLCLAAALGMAGCGPGTGGTGTGPATSVTPTTPLTPTEPTTPTTPTQPTTPTGPTSTTVTYGGTFALETAVTPVFGPFPAQSVPSAISVFGPNPVPATVLADVAAKFAPEGVTVASSCFSFSYVGTWQLATSDKTTLSGTYQNTSTVNGVTSVSQVPATLSFSFGNGQLFSDPLTVTIQDNTGKPLFGPHDLPQTSSPPTSPTSSATAC